MSEQTKPKEWTLYYAVTTTQHGHLASTPMFEGPEIKEDTIVVEKSRLNAQALEIEKLKAENEKLKSFNKRAKEQLQHEINLADKLDRLQSRVDKLKGALEFYKQREYMKAKNIFDHDGEYEDVDRGKTAKLALVKDAKLESESGE